MLSRIGVDSVITADAAELERASKIILPGVGTFDNGMKMLHELGLKKILDQKVLAEKTPVLGICLGMQLLTNQSEEGSQKGLGWIDAEVMKFKDLGKLRVPHMGWNFIKVSKENNITKNLHTESKFYFVHSYYVKCKNEEDEMIRCEYGNNFSAGIANKNVYGVQFHPEKSHKYGMRVLENFSNI